MRWVNNKTGRGWRDERGAQQLKYSRISIINRINASSFVLSALSRDYFYSVAYFDSGKHLFSRVVKINNDNQQLGPSSDRWNHFVVLVQSTHMRARRRKCNSTRTPIILSYNVKVAGFFFFFYVRSLNFVKKRVCIKFGNS